MSETEINQKLKETMIKQIESDKNILNQLQVLLEIVENQSKINNLIHQRLEILEKNQ